MKFNLQNFLFLLVYSISISSCREHLAKADRVIIIQPFEGFPDTKTKDIYNTIKEVNANTIVRTTIPLPVTAYYFPRNRYRADSLINYLKQYGNADTVIIGLTDKDISATKGNINDWGVMGLGFQPGNACVVSTFRLSKHNLPNQFYKVVIHEFGHTQGLAHCSNKNCFMRDAEGGNPLDEEKDFCFSCKTILKSKGWQLN